MKKRSLLILVLPVTLIFSKQNRDLEKALETFLRSPQITDSIPPNKCRKQPAVFIVLGPKIKRNLTLNHPEWKVFIGSKDQLFFQCVDSYYFKFSDLKYKNNKLKTDFCYFKNKTPVCKGKVRIKKSQDRWEIRSFRWQ